MKLPVTLRFLLTTLITAVVFTCLLLSLWVRQTADYIFTNRSDELVIRAVLKPNATEESAKQLFERLSAETPGLRGEVVGPAAGRALLSLQEPWIAQLPEVEIDPLPILIEIRHPQLIVAPQEIEIFNEKLGRDPLVEFVAFNQSGHDRLINLLNSSKGLVYYVTTWLLPLLAFIPACAQAMANIGISKRRYPYTAALSAFLTGIIGWATAATILSFWQAGALKYGMFSPLAFGTQLRWIFIAVLLSIIAAVVMNVMPVLGRDKGE